MGQFITACYMRNKSDKEQVLRDGRNIAVRVREGQMLPAAPGGAVAVMPGGRITVQPGQIVAIDRTLWACNGIYQQWGEEVSKEVWDAAVVAFTGDPRALLESIVGRIPEGFDEAGAPQLVAQIKEDITAFFEGREPVYQQPETEATSKAKAKSTK